MNRTVIHWVPCRFYEKVQALHQDPKASVDNPLLAFSLIKRLHSDWPNIIYSDEATRNTQGTGKMLSLVSSLSPRQSQEVVGKGWRSMRIDRRVEHVEEQDGGQGSMGRGAGEWMEEPGNRWRGWGTGGEARKLLEEQNGWRSRICGPQGKEL